MPEFWGKSGGFKWDFWYNIGIKESFIEHFTTFISGIWQIHPFREGNTRTVALFAIKYLRSLGYQASNDLFAAKSWYFRNALVRANYENVRLQIEKTQLPLEEFFKVLLFGYEIELKNRYLRVGCEYGSQYAEEIKDLHRRNDDTNVVTKSSNVVIKPSDVVINNVVKRADVIIKFTPIEEKAINILLRNPKISASQLGDQLGVVLRQAQRVMDSLKKKTGLKRRGARKNGEWYFEK
ncbi:MAG: Fic family protein [Kiritimatiellae bacterium]|nr:Fic family protein [Kiritimatiellia bacterium]